MPWAGEWVATPLRIWRPQAPLGQSITSASWGRGGESEKTEEPSSSEWRGTAAGHVRKTLRCLLQNKAPISIRSPGSPLCTGANRPTRTLPSHCSSTSRKCHSSGKTLIWGARRAARVTAAANASSSPTTRLLHPQPAFHKQPLLPKRSPPSCWHPTLMPLRLRHCRGSSAPCRIISWWKKRTLPSPAGCWENWEYF